MLFEQPAELNNIDSGTPASFWPSKVYRFIFPALLVYWILTSELVLAKGWLRGDISTVQWFGVLVLAFLFFIGFPFAFSWAMKLEHRKKKTLQIDEEGLRISAQPYFPIAWKRILSWHLEPIAVTTELQRLKLEYSRRGNRKRWSWSIVLRKPDQTGALNSGLEQIRRRGTLVPDLIELTSPPTRKQTSGKAKYWLLATAGFCFTHAAILVVPGIMLFFREPHATSNDGIALHMNAKLMHLITQYFSTTSQFRNFLLVAGGCLALLSLVFYTWAARISRAN